MSVFRRDTPFKICSGCGFVWQSRDLFLADTGVSLIGYQVDFDDLVAGWFLFNDMCGTTMAIPAGAFRDLYNGPVFETRLTGTDECPGYCLRCDEMGRCPARCECAYVREILTILNRRMRRADDSRILGMYDRIRPDFAVRLGPAAP